MIAKFKPSKLKGNINAPPSKSMAHRYLIGAALSNEVCHISGVDYSEDILASIDCLKALGAKITIDSATLANKALEVIEAVKLFNVPSSKVEVTIHPQSLVHSLIRTKDGVLYSQMSHPDMCHPILSALTWPEFTKSSLPPLDLSNNPVESPLTCTFAKPDMEKFPMLALGFKAASLGGAYPIAFNAANEIGVEAFINHEIGFYDISNITAKVLEKDWSKLPVTYEEVLLFDSMARKYAKEIKC